MGRKQGRTDKAVGRRARRIPVQPFKLRPQDTEWSADHLEYSRRQLARLKAQFAATRNPLHAWDAYAEARAHRLPVPIWVHDYFDLAWRNLKFLEQEPPKKKRIDGEIVEALGFVKGGVTVAFSQNAWEGRRVPERFLVHKPARVNPFARKKRGAYNPFTQPDDFKYAVAIYDKLLDGHKLLYAYESTKDKFEVSRRTVERAWSTYSAYFKPVDKK